MIKCECNIFYKLLNSFTIKIIQLLSPFSNIYIF